MQRRERADGMSINTTNIVSIYGKSNTVKAARKFVRTRASNFDFNQVKNMPFEVSNGSGFAANDWMEHNWGCRWVGGLEALLRSSPTCYRVAFLTVYGNANKILKLLSQRFKSATIENVYASEDLGKDCGVSVFENGYEVYGKSNVFNGNTAFSVDVTTRTIAKQLDDPDWKKVYTASCTLPVVYRVRGFDAHLPEENVALKNKQRGMLAFEYLFGNIDDAVKAYQTQAKLLLGRQAKGERAPIVNDTVWPPTVRGWFSATVDNRPRMIEIDTADVIGVPGWQEAHNG